MFGTEVDAELSKAARDAKNDGQARQKQSRVLAKFGLGEVKYRDPAAGAVAKQGPDGKTDSEAVVASSEIVGPVSL